MTLRRAILGSAELRGLDAAQKLTFPDSAWSERDIGLWVIFGRILNQPLLAPVKFYAHRMKSPADSGVGVVTRIWKSPMPLPSRSPLTTT